MGTSSKPLRIEKSCPLPSAHTRLRQAHELWHRTAAAYPDPDDFVLQLNQLVVTLRQVTFMIQTEKMRISDFEHWYESGWRERTKADPLMRWLHDARTRIEDVGDLEIASTAKVRVITSWLDAPGDTMPVSPALSASEIAARFPVEGWPEQIRKEGVLEVERQWVSNDLPDHELTDVRAHGYGVVATILAEAHERLGYRMRTFGGETHEGPHDRMDHLGGRLPCMLMTRHARTAHVELATGHLVELESKEFKMNRDAGHLERLEARVASMAIGREALLPKAGEDPLDWGRRWSSVARRTSHTTGFTDRSHSCAARSSARSATSG